MAKLIVETATINYLTPGDCLLPLTPDMKISQNKYPGLHKIQIGSEAPQQELVRRAYKKEKRWYFLFRLFESFLNEIRPENSSLYCFAGKLKCQLAAEMLRNASGLNYPEADFSELAAESLFEDEDAGYLGENLCEEIKAQFSHFIALRTMDIHSLENMIPIDLNVNKTATSDNLLDMDEQEMLHEFERKHKQTQLKQLNKVKYLTLLAKAKGFQREIAAEVKQREQRKLNETLDSVAAKMKEYAQLRFKERNDLNEVLLEVKGTILSNLIARREEFDLRLKSELYNEKEVQALKLIREKLMERRKDIDKRKKTAGLLLASLGKEDKEFLEYVSNIKKIQKAIDEKRHLLKYLQK